MLLAIVAAALLVLTTSPVWRIVLGAVIAWWIIIGASVLRAATGALLSQPGSQSRTQPAFQSLVDIVFGVLGLVASMAGLLAASGALRIRRR